MCAAIIAVKEVLVSMVVGAVCCVDASIFWDTSGLGRSGAEWGG